MAKSINDQLNLDWNFSFERKDSFPIDRSSVFTSLKDAMLYAQGGEDSRSLSGTSYVGQIISVVNSTNKTADIYKIINEKGDLELMIAQTELKEYVEENSPQSDWKAAEGPSAILNKPNMRQGTGGKTAVILGGDDSSEAIGKNMMAAGAGAQAGGNCYLIENIGYYDKDNSNAQYPYNADVTWAGYNDENEKPLYPCYCVFTLNGQEYSVYMNNAYSASNTTKPEKDPGFNLLKIKSSAGEHKIFYNTKGDRISSSGISVNIPQVVWNADFEERVLVSIQLGTNSPFLLYGARIFLNDEPYIFLHDPLIPSGSDIATIAKMNETGESLLSQSQVHCWFPEEDGNLGSLSIASLYNSDKGAVAIGKDAKAQNLSSIALGSQAIASGKNSLAVGEGAKAYGNHSVSMGQGSKAIGEYAFAYAQEAIASGMGAIAIGRMTKAQSGGAIAIGYNTKASGTGSFAFGNSSVASPQGGACAGGVSSEASGYCSVALGQSTKAKGAYSIALGLSSSAEKIYAFACGNTVQATGEYSFVFGKNTLASANYAIALGCQSESKGMYALAYGYLAKAKGAHSLAFGSSAEASGDYAIAFGFSQSTPIGDIPPYADGTCAIALGGAVRAFGQYSIALGEAYAIEDESTPGTYKPVYTDANGNYSIAMGLGACTTRDYALALGHGAWARNTYEIAFGQFNNPIEGSTIFTIGNGTSESARSNLFQINKDGKVYVANEQGKVDSVSLQEQLATLQSRISALEAQLNS